MENKVPRQEGALILESPKQRMRTKCDIDISIFKEKYVDYYINDKTGLFMILPNGEKLLNVLKDYFAGVLIKKFNFDKLILPKMSPISTYAKADVLGKWDSYLNKVTPFGKTKGVKEEYILEPLQCIPFYQYLEGKEINLNKGPVKIYDASGPTYRNEDLDKLKPLVKQREFHRSEFLYLGNKKDVTNLRENIMKELMNLFDKFKMRYRIIVGNGCFEISENEKVFPETIRDIPIKDIELYIPSSNSWLEIVGASILWNIQTKRFNIKSNNKEELWSGCTGFGLERLMYAFLAQKGFNSKKWPKEIKKLIEQKEK